jgi:hypothetical protein
MSYGLTYTDKSIGQLEHLPIEFVDIVEVNLLRLAERPVTLSVPIASPPYPPRGQLFHFGVTHPPGTEWFFTIIFLYAQDETALHILSVTWRELINE